MAQTSFLTSINGSYSLGGFTLILPAALAANSEIFQFRWTNTTRFAAIHRVRISAVVSTTFFAAGVPVQIALFKSTAWTVAGTGGTAVTMAALNKKRTTMDSSLIAAGDIRVATTAALGAGTKTLEGNALATIAAAAPITASLNGTIIPPSTYLFNADEGEYPLILGANEGISVLSVAVPITGTWTAEIVVDWTEGSVIMR